MKKQIRHISNKLTKTKVMARSQELRTYIPVTRKMDQSTLHEMLQKYNMVYIKPCCGSFGKGVMRMEKTARKERIQYSYQAGIRVRSFPDYETAYRAILKETQGKSYLVQKGIRLLVYEGRPFDIRVMVQRNLKGGWEATGLQDAWRIPARLLQTGARGGRFIRLKYC